MDGRFGPSHDRVSLTAREQQEIVRIETELASMRRVRTSSPFRPGVRARLLALCVVMRRPAIWLLPIGSVGMVLVVSTSTVAAAAFALAWTVGFAALLVDVRSSVRRVTRRWAS